MNITKDHWLNVNHPDLLEHILECQVKAGFWDELSTILVEDDDFIDTSIRMSELKSENDRLKEEHKNV